MKTKQLIFLSLTILFFFTQCKKSKVEYFDNGNIKKQTFYRNSIYTKINKDIYKSDKFELIYNGLKEINLDSVTVSYYNEKFNLIEQMDFFYEVKKHHRFNFYSNGHLKMEGILKNGLPMSEWKFYDKNEVLELVRDIKLIKGEPYINQELFYDENQDTIYAVSHFYEIKYDKDTINLNEEFKAIVNLPIPFHKKKNSNILVCISEFDSFDFNDDFSNENEIDKICFMDFETTKINKKWINGVNYNHSAAISRQFNSAGDKLIKGIIIEYVKNSKDSIGDIRKNYFIIPVHVLSD